MRDIAVKDTCCIPPDKRTRSFNTVPELQVPGAGFVAIRGPFTNTGDMGK